MTAWLQNLKPGDKVIRWSSSIFHPPRRIKTIDKVTKTQVVCGKERFNKSDGYLCGKRSDWDYTRLIQATPSELEKVEAGRLRKKGQSINSQTLSLDQLRRIDAIIREEK
jgi:hypothetical protein